MIFQPDLRRKVGKCIGDRVEEGPYTAAVSVQRLDIDLDNGDITFRELLVHGITKQIVELWN